MNPDKNSKKALRGLISDSINEAISSLDLPQPTKKIKKLVDRNAKKLAEIYADVLKREEKKKKKAEKLLHDALNKNGKKKKKVRSEERLVAPVKV